MKKFISFKTFGLLSVVGLAGFGAFSCKKETSNNTPALTPPVSFGFKSVQLRLAAPSTTTTKKGWGRYDSSGTLKAHLKNDTLASVFADKAKTNYDLTIPSSVFSSSGGNGDLVVLTLDVESGADVTVSKKESQDSTAFSFGLGKKATDSTITDLPKQLVKDNGIVLNTFQGDAIVIQLNTTYENLKTKMSNGNVVLTVTASKSGKASVTKTLTVKGSSSSS